MTLPLFIAFGEALTDLLQTAPGHWRSFEGGAPWNVARAMSRRGIRSAFGGAVSGGVFGDALLAASRAAGLDERFIQQYADKSPLLAIVECSDPPSYSFVGDDSADLHFDPTLLPAGWPQAVRWAHFGGISLARAPLAPRLVALATALKALGVRISYDPNYRLSMDSRYDATLLRMAALADVIKVSSDDLRGLFRSDDTGAGLAQLRGWAAPDALLLLTEGADGAALFAGDRRWQARPPSIVFVDSIGAGDAAMAGLLHSLITAPDAAPERHLQAAVDAGAAACSVAGAGGGGGGGD